MSISTLKEAARGHCELVRTRREQTERVTAHVVAASLRYGLTVAEVAELTGLTPEEVEKHRGMDEGR